jgi:hypothetical protein
MLDLLPRFRVLQSVSPAWDYLFNDIGSFPRGVKFSCFLLLEPKDEVADHERSGAHPSAVVISEALLINCGTSRSYVACFVDSVAVVFECGRGPFFCIGSYPRGFESDIMR